MKLSLKFPDGSNRRGGAFGGGNVTGDGDALHAQPQPILKAKVPITVLSQPLATAVTATTAVPSDVSLSLATNFASGPSLKLSYSPQAAAPSPASPFSVTLKSGLGLFGSPKDSPLTFCAHFSLSPSLNHPTPIFSLQFKPRIGHFSFHSSASSNPKPRSIPSTKPLVASESALNGEFLRTEAPDHLDSGPNGVVGTGFKPAEAPVTWQELKLEPFGGKGKGSMKPTFPGNLNFAENVKNRGDTFSGVSIRARTALPIKKHMRMNFHWGVNMLANGVGFTMPYLTVQKIGIERDEEVKNVKAESKRETPVGDVNLFEGLFLWMRKDLEGMQRENEEMKQYLDEMRSGIGKRGFVSPSLAENKGDFGMWRSKRSGMEGNGTGSSYSSANQSLDVESELRRAIKSSSN